MMTSVTTGTTTPPVCGDGEYPNIGDDMVAVMWIDPVH